MYTSGLLALLSFPFREGVLTARISIIVGALFLLPGGIDGTTQLFGERESTNKPWVATGLLLGIGVVLFAEGVLFALISP